jgi:hypothetical protein
LGIEFLLNGLRIFHVLDKLMRIEFSLDDRMVFMFWIRSYYVAINLNEFNLILVCLDMMFRIKD